jgi:DNA invertase Pin-like site-specific DNA recombinase
MMSEKIRPHHLERKAILYVRQSSAHQVLHNRESSALQYAMRDRLTALGWSRIETVDDDLGRSAAGGVARAGFDRMVAEVCLGKVGAVAAREVSRFARNSRDWQQLIEMCRVVDTVLIDQETVYAPRQGNDRLLLGLKGSLNEYELDLLRHRSLSARYEKARRGELIVAAPVGFVKAGDRLQRCSRLEARSQDTENQLEQIGHQDAGLRRPLAASTPNRIFGTHNGPHQRVLLKS